MVKFLILLLLILFMATPLVALLSSHDNCSEQICHVLMTYLFILVSTTIASVIFLKIQLINKSSLFETLYFEEVFLPPRF